MQIESSKAEAIVNFVQTHEHTHCQTQVRVGRNDVVVGPGQMARIECKVPYDLTSPVALFEVNCFEQLDLGDGLVEVHRTRRPYVEIPVWIQVNSLRGGTHLSIFIIWTMNNKQ